MKLIVNPHKIEIKKELVNEREIDITKCEFEFADEITDNYVKEAYFTFKGVSYKQLIINNECDIPNEVLAEKGQVEIGVVAYLVESEEEIKRYNPSPAYFNTLVGSLKDNAENSEPITPTDKEQIEQAIADLEVDKQDKLIAGDNITIEDNVISAVDTIYDDSEIRADISDLQTNKADKSEIPDVSDFITKDVNNLTNYTLSVDTGHSIEFSVNSSTYVMTLNLKNSAGTTISTGTVDLPLESVVVSGNYDSTNKKIVLTLQNGNTIDIPVGDLVSGLQSEITINNKLSSDLVDDTNNTNKFVTSAEKEKLANLKNYESAEYSWLYNNATKSSSLELMREINTAKANKMIKEKSLSLMQTGDYFQHDATIKYHYSSSMLYAFYVNNTVDRGDSAYSTNAYVRLSRLGGGGSGNISYKESYDVAKNGDTIDGLTVISGCGVPNAVLNGDTLYLYWSCKLSDNAWYECYNTFDCINKTLGTPHRLNLGNSYFSCKNLVTNVELDFNEQISMNASIGDLNGVYYACVCSNNLLKNGVIIKSTDLINWTFVKEPSFIDITSNAIYEGAMAGFNDSLYLALRQKSENANNDTVPMILAKLDTEGNVLQNVLLPSVSSRPCFFKRGTTELYLAYPTEKRHNTVCLKIAENIIDSIPYQDIAISGNYVYIEPRTQNLQFLVYTAGTTGLVVSSMNGMQKTADNIMDEYASIPTNLSDLADDSTHRTVTDEEKVDWNSKVGEEELNQSQAVQDTEISYLENITEQLPKTSATGADVTLNDIIEAKMSVGVKGNTEQDGTPTPSSPVNFKVATGNNTILISNSDNTESQTYTINLGNIILCGLGDYRDYFYKDEDKWYLYKTVDKKIYTGSQAEGWFKYSTNSFSSGKISSVRKSLCDYYEFKEGKTTATSLLDGEYCYASSTNNYAILIKNANYDDVNSFKTWLSTHNITIYYVLETPTTTEITDTTLIEQLNTIKEVMSYAGQTNITSTYETGNAPLFINAEALSDIEKELDNKVDDVQLNGTSIVSNGVANIPMGTTQSLGVVKAKSDAGTTINQSGELIVNPASDQQIKEGTGNRRPITPDKENASVFYGLAKASGDTTQASSTNPVGTYTDTAKQKIREMLGAESNEWEKLVDKTLQADNSTALAYTDYAYEGKFKKIMIQIRGTVDTNNANISFYRSTNSSAYQVFGNVARNSDTLYEFIMEGSPYLQSTAIRDSSVELKVYNVASNTWTMLYQGRAPMATKMDEVTDLKITSNGNFLTGTRVVVWGLR